MKRKLYYLATLFCLLASLNACKDEDNQPLEFYDSYYEVPMGGIRYIGPKSGNGDYNLEMEHTQIAAAGIEKVGAECQTARIYMCVATSPGKLACR